MNKTTSGFRVFNRTRAYRALERNTRQGDYVRKVLDEYISWIFTLSPVMLILTKRDMRICMLAYLPAVSYTSSQFSKASPLRQSLLRCCKIISERMELDKHYVFKGGTT